jgi:hypothetical protein
MQQSKRFWTAIVIYAILAVLAWTTMTNDPIGGPRGSISFRGLTLILLGFFAARTVLHWRAEKIRAEKQE